MKVANHSGGSTGSDGGSAGGGGGPAVNKQLWFKVNHSDS